MADQFPKFLALCSGKHNDTGRGMNKGSKNFFVEGQEVRDKVHIEA